MSDEDIRSEPADDGAFANVSESGSAAGLGIRTGARLLDALLIGIPVSILFGLIGLGPAVSSLLLALLWFGYFVWFETNKGGTFGKQLLGLCVSGQHGGFPSLEVAAKRNVWMLLGLIPVVGGLLSLVAVIVIMVTIYSDAQNLGYHDTFAGARVDVKPA